MKKFTLFMSLLTLMIVGLQARAADVYVETDNPTFNVYTWNPEQFGAWPGTLITEAAQLTEVNGTQYYKMTIEGTGRFIIFNKDGAQTQNIPLQDGDNFFTYPINGDFTQYETTNPPIQITSYTVAGAAALMGVEWDPAATQNDMTLQDDGTYKLVKEGVQLAAGGYEYKVVGNHTWSIWEVPMQGNQTLDIAEDGKYNVTFTLTLGDENVLTAEAVKVEDVVIEHNYTVTGAEELMGSYWDTNDEANLMALQEDGTYKLVKENVELLAQGYDYKVVRDHSWDWAVPQEGNQTLTIAEDGKYNVTFTLTLGEQNVLTAEAVKIVEPLQYLLHYGHDGENDWQDAAFVAGEGTYEGKLVAKDVVFTADTQFGIKYGDIWYAGMPDNTDLYWIHAGWHNNIPLSSEQGVVNFIINEADTYTFVLTVGEEGITMDVEGFPVEVLVGDLNGDGVVDSLDVNIIVNMSLNKAPKTEAADLNGDQEVDGLDVNRLINIVLNK